MSGFEGSFLGAAAKISPAAIMECKICWTVYDPAEGDETRQIDPGTPFLALPGDWSCPTCSAPREQFLVREDPGSEAAAEATALARAAARLEADFREVWNGTMRDVPLANRLLRVEAVGLRRHEGRPLGVLLAPWCMNLVLLPAEGEDWSGLVPGTRETLAFPSGDYEFLHNRRAVTGGYKACSVFSAMGDFRSHQQAVEVAQAVMVALFDPATRAETDRAADIRAARERELAAQAAPAEPAPADPAPTRRVVLTGGLAATGD
jgi:[NiFe] hydrogenase assembly HybE family chaperone